MLGVNGSGKTTTFRAITNEIIYETGRIEIVGNDTKKDFGKIRKSIGYCPQNDAIFEQLTVRETFDYYLKLKILKYHSSCHDLESQIVFLLKKFGLEKFKNTYSTNLSGGNKRKLNFAIALMHNPNLILLDEPSTGVDPESRRIMWKNINEIPLFCANSNMILSTHSMEEAEILCDTIGWMKGGNFLCIGNPEKLKIKYSPEYYISLKVKNSNDNLSILYNSNNYDIIFKDLNNLKNFLSKVNLRETIKQENIESFQILIEILSQIEDLCISINLISCVDDSFEIGIKFDEKSQAGVFSIILKMKVK